MISGCGPLVPPRTVTDKANFWSWTRCVYALQKAVCGTQPLGLAVSKATGGFVTL